jgi:hypothetical protein
MQRVQAACSTDDGTFRGAGRQFDQIIDMLRIVRAPFIFGKRAVGGSDIQRTQGVGNDGFAGKGCAAFAVCCVCRQRYVETGSLDQIAPACR